MQLSNATLEKAKTTAPGYDRDAMGIGIVHFGPGAFHRAHQAVFTEDAIEKSGGDWGICAVSLSSARAAKALTPQDGLYTLAIRDKIPEFRVIGAIKRVLFAKEERAIVMDVLCAPSTKFVTLTITEKGYALTGDGTLDVSNPMVKADIENPDAPVSAMGYIVAASAKRRAAGTAPLTIISCDNLPGNGDKLKAACVALAAKTDPDLADYLSREVRFPNTMVDSITPATDDSVLRLVEEATGLSDHGAVQREAFAQWVIEDTLPADRPDWSGAGAIITDDVEGYETTKLRILNGAHSTLTYLGLLAGIETVEDAINHPHLRSFVDGLIRKETIPTITAPRGLDLPAYWVSIIARFENPHIRHNLEQISHDGSQKIPARIFPVIEYHAAKGHVAKRACYVAAAWIEFTRQRRAAGRPPVDGFLSHNESALPDTSLCAKDYGEAFLENANLIPDFIRSNADVRSTIIADCISIDKDGVMTPLTPHSDGPKRMTKL